jgi:hypothetical protein
MSDTHLALLTEARKVLERYMFDGDICRDDIAEICQKIDDVLPMPTQTAVLIRSSETRVAA